MTLTDDQLRSLRAIAEHRQTHIDNPADRGFLISPTTVLSLVEEVLRLRDHTCLNSRFNGRTFNEWVRHYDDEVVPALAAKAEAGKGLAGYAEHKRGCVMYDPLRRPTERCDCGLDAALARWEAANG